MVNLFSTDELPYLLRALSMVNLFSTDELVYPPDRQKLTEKGSEHVERTLAKYNYVSVKWADCRTCLCAGDRGRSLPAYPSGNGRTVPPASGAGEVHSERTARSS